MKIFLYGKVRPNDNPHLKCVEYTMEKIDYFQLEKLFSEPDYEVFLETGLINDKRWHFQGVEDFDIRCYKGMIPSLLFTSSLTEWLPLSKGDKVIATLGDGQFIAYTATVIKSTEAPKNRPARVVKPSSAPTSVPIIPTPVVKPSLTPTSTPNHPAPAVKPSSAPIYPARAITDNPNKTWLVCITMLVSLVYTWLQWELYTLLKSDLEAKICLIGMMWSAILIFYFFQFNKTPLPDRIINTLAIGMAIGGILMHLILALFLKWWILVPSILPTFWIIYLSFKLRWWHSLTGS